MSENPSAETTADPTGKAARAAKAAANGHGHGGPGPAGPSESLLQVTDLTVRYGKALALSSVSLDVGAGAVAAVVGPNGAGKSTLARTVSGLVPVVSGRIVFAGQDITRWNSDRIRRAGLVHLPEGRGIFPGLSVVENLRMATTLLPRKERPAALDRGYELFPVLGQRRRQAAGTLSGGEQQMVSLARALMVSPRLIIADEMSLGLAPAMVDVVFDGLTKARDAGISVVIIEQFVHRALAFSDRCTILSRGQVAWTGAAAEAKDEVLQRFLGASAA